MVTALMTFAEYKLDITSEMMLNSILQTAKHPFLYGIAAVEEENPLVIIGSIAIIGYVVFLYIKSFSKKKTWETDKNDTHGSAKWTDKRDLVKDNNYHFIGYKHLYNEWKKSIM